jgi:hypothetical protein
MAINFPIEILHDITGTVSVTIKLGREMRAHAQRKGIDPDEIEESVALKEQDLARLVADYLKVDFDE